MSLITRVIFATVVTAIAFLGQNYSKKSVFLKTKKKWLRGNLWKKNVNFVFLLLTSEQDSSYSFVSHYTGRCSFIREYTELLCKRGRFTFHKSIFLCWSCMYDDTSSQWRAQILGKDASARSLMEYRWPCKVVRRSGGVRSAVWCVGCFARERKRGIEESSTSSIREPDAPNSIEGADKLNREIYNRARARAGKKNRVTMVLVTMCS